MRRAIAQLPRFHHARICRCQRRSRSLSAAKVREQNEAEVISHAPETDLFPYAEPFRVDGTELSAAKVIETLRRPLSDDRVYKILNVCAQRTFDVVPVVEGLYDLGNVAAVSRSCDGALSHKTRSQSLQGDTANSPQGTVCLCAICSCKPAYCSSACSCLLCTAVCMRKFQVMVSS
jgi:hypothetical protein